MSRQQRRMALFVTVCLLMLGSTSGGAWAGGPNDEDKDKGSKEISLVNISKLTVNSASAFHRVAVSRKDPDLVAIAWRDYGLPINTNAGAAPGERTADCHVSVSKDGGKTFHDTNLMPFLRQNTGDPELPTQPAPGLYYCNAPWVAIGDDHTIYAGGSVFTPLGDRNWYPARGTDAPKQGRALVTVSRDNGKSWSPPTFGIRISNFEPGAGLGCSNNLPCVSSPPGTDQWHTPWDGAIAVTAPHSKTFYSKAGDLIAASEDRAKTFGPAHEINVPGWTFSVGKIDASRDLLVVPIIASVTPLAATCPCLGVATSTDKGATWTAQVIAQADEFNPSGTGDTAHYPFAAADPNTSPGSMRWPRTRRIASRCRSSGRRTTATLGKTRRSAPCPSPTRSRAPARSRSGTRATGRFSPCGAHSMRLTTRTWPAGPGWFDTFAALLHGNDFGPTIRVSPQSSKYPTRTTVGANVPNTANYMLNNGGGDFSTFITGNRSNSRLSASRTLRAIRTRARWTRISPGSRSS